MATFATGRRRLLKLAAILDTADAEHKKRGEPTYDQEHVTHPCGTPACAWGHWQGTLPKGSKRVASLLRAPIEFGISMDEVVEIFGRRGCGDARTAQEAAAYIRRFVARHTVTKAA